MAAGFNFARKPYENERLPRLVFVATAAIVLGVTLVHGFYLARYLVREQEALDITVDELRDEIARTDSEIERARATLAREQTALGNDRTEFLTRIYRHKGFSWTGLFNELEEITPADVRITSIAPFEEDDEIAVTMSLVGRTLSNVLEMVSALEESSFFTTVFPLEDSEEASLDTIETGIAATLQLQYVGIPDDAEEPEAEVMDDPLDEPLDESVEGDEGVDEEAVPAEEAPDVPEPPSPERVP